MQRNLLITGFLALATVVLSGCADWQRHMQSRLPEPKPAYADKSITVAPTRSVHVVSFAEGSSKLSDHEIAYLQSFIGSTAVSRGAQVSVEQTSRRTRLAASRAQAVEAWLRKEGYEVTQLRAIETGSGDGVRVMVDHLVAMGPNCPNWAYHPYDSFGAQVSPNMGCADRTNLAAMVANPRDLVVGDTPTLPSGPATTWGEFRYRTDSIRPVERVSATSTQ